MNRKEDAKSFIWAALVLMAEGLVVRLLLGASPTRELLQFVGVVVAAFLAVLFFRHIPWDRLPKTKGYFWGILGYGAILGLGVLVMLIPYHPMAVAPVIAAVLPTLALLPLLRFTEARSTPGFIVVLIGVLAAAAVTWSMGFLAASVIVGLVGISASLIRRRRFGEGDERWIGHLVFAGIVLVGLWLLLMSELNRPWLGTWLQSTLNPSVNSEGEEFRSYITRVILENARLFGRSTLNEILVWTSPQQYMAVDVLLPDADSHLVLTTIAHRWGYAPLFLILVSMAAIPVNGCFLANAQRGFQRGITLTFSLLLGFPILFFILQSLGFSIISIDFCPFFSGGFVQNLVYLLLILAATGHLFPPIKGDSHAKRPVKTERKIPDLSACRLMH